MGITYVGNYGLQAGTSGSPALTMIPPVGSQATDKAQFGIVSKLSSVTPTTPAGWALLGTGVVGTGVDGAGAGPMRMTVFEQILSGAAGNTAVDIGASTGACAMAAGRIWRKGANEIWAPGSVQFGSDNTSDTTHSAAMAAQDGIKAGDWVWSIGCVTIQAPSLNTRNNTIPGTTKTHTGIDSSGTPNGNDMFIWTDNEQITAGSQSGVGIVTGSTTTATTGGGAQIHVALLDGPHYQTSQYGGFF